MLSKQSSNVPTMDWEEINVYEHPTQLIRIAGNLFSDFRARVKTNRVGTAVFNSPFDFIYFVRNPSIKLVNVLRKHGKINIIYSQWEGYLKEEHKQYFTDNINTLKQDENISFHSIHTSGHVTVPDLIKFAKALNSNKIVPIHTAYPEKFKIEFEKEDINNVTLWEDGKEYLI